MLLSKDCGRNQVYYLLSFLDRLKSNAKCHLCFTISHISADQPIHDFSAFHVLFCRFNGQELILRLLKRKHFLKLFLPYGIRSVLETGLILTGRIQFHQFFGDILYRTAHFGFCFFPFQTIQFI